MPKSRTSMESLSRFYVWAEPKKCVGKVMAICPGPNVVRKKSNIYPFGVNRALNMSAHRICLDNYVRNEDLIGARLRRLGID